MIKKDLCYIVRDTRKTVDDGQGYELAIINQIDFYDYDTEFNSGITDVNVYR